MYQEPKVSRNHNTFASLAVVCAVCTCLFTTGIQRGSQPQQEHPRPAQASRCDLSIPIRISMSPLNKAEVGGTARFAVNVESGIDPDLVKRMWVEYELPERMRRNRAFPARFEIPRLARQNREELSVTVPDNGRYAIRARLMVELMGGRIVSTTATRWINLGNVPPEGWIGRMVDPDGTGIQVYQGRTVRN
jgi:hypothetical protein